LVASFILVRPFAPFDSALDAGQCHHYVLNVVPDASLTNPHSTLYPEDQCSEPSDRHFVFQSFVFNCVSFVAMNARMSADMSSSLSHCSLYKVTGKRPMP